LLGMKKSRRFNRRLGGCPDEYARSYCCDLLGWLASGLCVLSQTLARSCTLLLSDSLAHSNTMLLSAYLVRSSLLLLSMVVARSNTNVAIFRLGSLRLLVANPVSWFAWVICYYQAAWLTLIFCCYRRNLVRSHFSYYQSLWLTRLMCCYQTSWLTRTACSFGCIGSLSKRVTIGVSG